MNTKPSSHKSMYTIAGIIIISAAAYFMFAPAVPQTDSLLQADPTNAEGNASSARVLSLLGQIKSLRIDTSIFKSEAYQSLRDYSVDIPELDVGRPNPFAPLPGTVVAPPVTGRTR